MTSILYSKKFYDGQVDGSLRSARVVLSTLRRFVQPQSVIDFGCGRGAWLTAAGELGSTRLFGIDGPWVKQEDILDRRIQFKAQNMEKPIELSERFDLAMSVEVAEHLSGNAADAFVHSLCMASDLVLFASAVPNQGGTGHINEQWQSYWCSRFNACGYSYFDVIRPAIWHDNTVEWWYRQNLMLFVRSDSEAFRKSLTKFIEGQQPITDVVHPAAYEKIFVKPPLRLKGRLILRWFAGR